jgi:uncharacterized membrane protein
LLPGEVEMQQISKRQRITLRVGITLGILLILLALGLLRNNTVVVY